MLGFTDRPTLILDTPNNLLYHNHRGEKQLLMNLIALVNFLSKNNRFKLVVSITPMIKRNFKETLDLILYLTFSNGGTTFETKNFDPDLDIIREAIKRNGYILSNDKFRDYPQYLDYINENRLHYEINDNQIIIIEEV